MLENSMLQEVFASLINEEKNVFGVKNVNFFIVLLQGTT